MASVNAQTHADDEVQDLAEELLVAVDDAHRGGLSHVDALVAEMEGKVVGFILGDASGWEYGVPENIGWIDMIGVDPSYQKKGVAKMLIEEIINYMKKVGVDTVYTLVNWRDWGLLQFFDAMGFSRGDMINLEFKIED